MKKKGQLKTMEVVVVLIAFAFLFGLTFVFYAKFKSAEINRLGTEAKVERADSLLNKISKMPELRCSLSFGRASEINCIDTFKLLAFTELKGSGSYNKFFSGLNEVRIIRVFPSPDSQAGKKCYFAFDYPKNCGYWRLYKKGSSTESYDTFVSLCTQKGPSDYECEIGRLVVSV